MILITQMPHAVPLSARLFRCGDSFQLLHQQLVDLAPVHVDHLELPALVGEYLALFGQMLEYGQGETCGGGKFAFLAIIEGQPIAESFGVTQAMYSSMLPSKPV